MFLSELKQQHDLSETTFLVDGFGYLTALARCDLGSQLDAAERNMVEKWFQTLTMRIERLHSTWTATSASAARWLAAFGYYYNWKRPNHALNDRTPIEEVID